MNPKVSICMITYNHAKFIGEAIQSVLDQKTNFEFELVIGEDLSTDETRFICLDYANKYPQIVKVLPNEKNFGMIPNLFRTYEACKGEYIAMLEGDDYWIDTMKLQKQVDFLSTHPDYVGIGSNAFKLENNKISNIPIFPPEKILKIIKTEDFIHKNRLLTLTVMVRAQFISNEVKSLLTNAPIGDWPIWTYFSRFGLFKMVDENMAVYRIHSGGAFSGLSYINQQINDLITRRIINSITEQKYKNTIKEDIRNKALKLIKFQIRNIEPKLFLKSVRFYFKPI